MMKILASEGLISFTSLLTAEQAAPLVKMTPARLRELAIAQIIPHVRVDDGEPLFQKKSLADYVRSNLAYLFDGAKMPMEFRVAPIHPVASVAVVPIQLAHFADKLFHYPWALAPPCVYFLVLDSAVVYVGQSIELPSRLAQHQRDMKRWDRVFYLPTQRELLGEVESEFIRILKPALNQTHGLPAKRKENGGNSVDTIGQPASPLSMASEEVGA